MSRIAYCPACAAIKNGVKTRIALEHTCGLSDAEIAEFIKSKTAENNQDDDRPVMVVLTNDNLVCWAGEPRKPTAKEWREWMQPGWQVITMPIKDYRAADFKWMYDKNKNDEQ